MDRCSSCGAKVRFAVDDSGKKQILNWARVRLYTEPDHQGQTRVLAHPDGQPMRYYISHFVSCPNAAQHSKAGK